MNAAIDPTIEVDPFVVTGANASTGYLLQMRFAGSAGAIPLAPPLVALPYPSFAAMISALSLSAVKNYPSWPYAYVVGVGANNFTTDAIALAAAKADCDKIVAARNANLAATGLNPSNPFVTVNETVYGPF